MNQRISTLLASAALALTTFNLPAENWPQWRGPFFNGSGQEKGIPAQIGKTENVVWTAPMPGQSGSTPIVWGDKIFVSSADNEKNLLLLCLNRKDGKELWRKTVAVGDRKTDQGNNMASPSPVTDGKRVVISFGTGDIAAFDLDGKELWARNLSKEFGKLSLMWLYGSSPLLYKDKLYVQVLQRNPSSYPHSQDGKAERESFLLCLDVKSGKDLFRQVRPTDAIVESQEAYTTPYPHEVGGKTQIIIVGGDYVTAHDPSTGAEIWRSGGLNSKKDQWWRIITSPVGGDGLVFAAAPKREPLLAIKPNGKGVVTDTHIAWKFTENPPDVCTPLFYKGKLFVLDGDKKVMTCLDPKTGQKLWSGELGGNAVFRASPTGVDDKIYCINARGYVVVLSAGDKFEILHSTNLEEIHDHSSIVASQGQLFLRTRANLYCFGSSKSVSSAK